MQITKEVQAQIDAQNEVNFQQAVARVNLVGKLTNWRKMNRFKKEAREAKVLSGYAKTLNILSRVNKAA